MPITKKAAVTPQNGDFKQRGNVCVQLLKTFPFFQLVSWEAAASITGVIAANLFWVRPCACTAAHTCGLLYSRHLHRGL